jgi:hypothetical protein
VIFDLAGQETSACTIHLMRPFNAPISKMRSVSETSLATGLYAPTKTLKDYVPVNIGKDISISQW